VIGADTGPQTLKLCDWLETTFIVKDVALLQSQDVLRLVLDCYVRRKTLLFDCLELFASQGAPHAREFGRLSLLLCKLGKHVTVTRKVVEATVYLRDDFREPIRVAVMRSAPERRFPLITKEGTLKSILGRAFSSKAEMNEFKVRLQSLWNPDEIETILSRERPGKTRVHAELLVADHFFRNNLHFLGGRDRYIGCSKPSCYLCDAYLRNHPAGFAVARSHQKIYTTWRCPDILEDDPKAYYLQQVQEQSLLDLIDCVRKDLKKEVGSRAPRAAIPPDSTAGITSENHSVFGPFALSKMITMLNGWSQIPPRLSLALGKRSTLIICSTR
jgi:OTT_1508-like deaminase